MFHLNMFKNVCRFNLEPADIFTFKPVLCGCLTLSYLGKYYSRMERSFVRVLELPMDTSSDL